DRSWGLGRRVAAVETGLVLAAAAHVGIHRGDLGRRGGGEREVEVAEGADVTAEGAGWEQHVHGQRRSEVADREPGRQPGAGPQVEDLVAEEESQEQGYDEPLVAQRPGPRELPRQ